METRVGFYKKYLVIVALSENGDYLSLTIQSYGKSERKKELITTY